LATKHTRKKKSYNKEYLSKKLDKLASNVAKKGIHIVSESSPGYKVINYVNKKVLIDNIPYKSLAKQVADKVNKSKEPVHLDRLDYAISRYYKHVNDITFYKHTMKSAKDYNVVISTGARLQESIYALKETKENLILF
jgi:hypothetical protein